MAEKKVCFSIAVARPEKLEPLPGAIEAAASIAAWARRPEAGFDVHAITDAERGEVTVDLLNRELLAVLNGPDVIDHLIVHFAGHGVSPAADNQLLLLTHWFSQPTEAIKVNRFMRLLQFYQVKRVSLFVDACRTRKTALTEEVDGSGILDRPEDEPREFRQDRFLASVHGSDAYMLKDLANGGPSRCIFSTVLVKTLCGGYPEAIDTRGTDRVVGSAQITNALELHVPLEAGRHGIKTTPSVQPGFVVPNDIYTRLPIDLVPPELPPPSPPQAEAAPRRRGGGGLGDLLGGLFGRTPVEEEPPTSALHDRFVAEYQEEERPTHFETGTGCAVVGATPSVWVVTPPITMTGLEERERATWWLFDDSSSFENELARPASLLIRLADTKAWIGAAVVPRKIVTFTVAGPGAASVIYRPAEGYVPESDLVIASSRSEDIVARLRAGTLTGNAALDVAVQIRTDKHVDPTLGAVAAYLYDAVGDRDNIRRIAFFYAQAGEPIPFDVALLADLRGKSVNGQLVVDIPAVPGRAPRTDAEAQHGDYFRETYPIEQRPVAGGFPWLRQGWALLDTVRLPVHPGVIELAQTPRILLPSPFTTLAPDAGNRLVELIGSGMV